jgi:broad specificity phosphatase PhoE
MIRALCILISFSTLSSVFAQSSLDREIRQIQLERFDHEVCLDFIRPEDLPDRESRIDQIIIIRHGEPAMNKKGWKNRHEAIKYVKMYDSVGVYQFDNKPICLRQHDMDTAYTSKLPRAIDTAEKTLGDEYTLENKSLFNEFERQVIRFPNIKLPGKFWSVTTRLVWMMGFNHSEVESFKEAKERAWKAANFLNEKAVNNGKCLLFSHGFLNRYIKKYLKKQGYEALDLDGQKYLGAYYFYRVN